MGSHFTILIRCKIIDPLDDSFHGQIRHNSKSTSSWMTETGGGGDVVVVGGAVVVVVVGGVVVVKALQRLKRIK